MRTKTNVKAGGAGLVFQHNQTAAGLKVQTSIKAGPFGSDTFSGSTRLNHNQTSAAIKMRSNVKASGRLL